LHAGQLVTKVVDFGIAKSLRGDVGASMHTRTGQTLGTPSYMSPEQCRGLKDIDRRTDLWSLGVIAYQCLLGTEPFQGEVLGDLVLRICVDPLPVPSEHSSVPLPSVFDAWFAKAVARDRAARFQSAAELAAAFTRLSTAVGLGAATAPPAAGAPLVAGVSELLRTSRDTDSNASVGLGVVARRKLGTPLKLGAAALLAAALGLGLWVFRGTAALPSLVRGVQSLKSAPVSGAEPLAPRSERPVPSGRRWHSSPEPAAAAAPTPEQGAATEAKPPRPPSPAPPRTPRLQAPDTDIRHSR
jgi:eukaryotic-like serine/threonine-protein kinase